MNDINIISDSYCNTPIENFKYFSEVAAYHLKRSFISHGYTAKIHNLRDVELQDIPKANHTIITSERAAEKFLTEEGYEELIRRSTRGYVCAYHPNDFEFIGVKFDIVFTIVEPLKTRSDKFVRAGWGVDAERFNIPQSSGRIVFIDSFLGSRFENVFDHIEMAIRDVVMDTDLRIIQPRKYFHDDRIPYGKYSELLRNSTYYISTHCREGGLAKLESACSGCLPIIHNELYRPRTDNDFENYVWTTKEELKFALEQEPDKQLIRDTAVKHKWDSVVSRMLMRLER